jgi:hypothetical protein
MAKHARMTVLPALIAIALPFAGCGRSDHRHASSGRGASTRPISDATFADARCRAAARRLPVAPHDLFFASPHRYDVYATASVIATDLADQLRSRLAAPARQPERLTELLAAYRGISQVFRDFYSFAGSPTLAGLEEIPAAARRELTRAARAARRFGSPGCVPGARWRRLAIISPRKLAGLRKDLGLDAH